MGFFTNDPFVVATGGPPVGRHFYPPVATGGPPVATTKWVTGNAVATGGLPWVVSTGTFFCLFLQMNRNLWSFILLIALLDRTNF